MRISDWSSDVCSSDLHSATHLLQPFRATSAPAGMARGCHFPHSIGRGGSASLSWRRIARTDSVWRDCNSNRKSRPDSRSEEHTSELQSLMRISYAVFCLKKKTTTVEHKKTTHNTNTTI